MEQKKLDLNSIIGFVLIFGILVWIMYQNQPDPAQVEADKKEQVAKEKKIRERSVETALTGVDTTSTDSLNIAKLRSKLGAFAYSGTLPSAKDGFTILENELVYIKVANKRSEEHTSELQSRENLVC